MKATLGEHWNQFFDLCIAENREFLFFATEHPFEVQENGQRKKVKKT
jgi:hypothetical protein